MINKFYLLCVIFSGSPDLTLKTCFVHAVNNVRSRKIHAAVPESSASDFEMAIEKLKRL